MKIEDQPTVKYSVKYIHKISPSVKDVGPSVDLSWTALHCARNLAKELRDQKVLAPGTRIRAFRDEGDRLVVFPDRGIWHAVILTRRPDDSETEQSTE
jgi:4-hydroxyphenylpyruvate dioxygenase-like putative hemolysin